MRIGIVAGAGALVAAAAGILLGPRLWRRMLDWGATAEEVRRALPGDELLPDADLVATRAISIAAPPAEVWPWLVQIGVGRAGAYAYDWLDRLFGLDMRSSRRIVPELQGLAVGDMVPVANDGTGLRVRAIERRARAGHAHRRRDVGLDLDPGARRRHHAAHQPHPDGDRPPGAARPAGDPAPARARLVGHGAQDAARPPRSRRRAGSTRRRRRSRGPPAPPPRRSRPTCICSGRGVARRPTPTWSATGRRGSSSTPAGRTTDRASRRPLGRCWGLGWPLRPSS